MAMKKTAKTHGPKLTAVLSVDTPKQRWSIVLPLQRTPTHQEMQTLLNAELTLRRLAAPGTTFLMQMEAR